MHWKFTLLAICLAVFTVPVGGADLKQSVTLFFTGYVHGNYGPCGCKANPTGGLSRRAGYIEQYRAENEGTIIQVDLGGYFEPPGPHAAAVNQFLFDGLKRLPLDILNLNSDDLNLWKENRPEAFSQTQVISSNLSPRQDSLPLPLRYAVKTVDLGTDGVSKPVRIGFLGLTDPGKVKPNSGFGAEDPLQAVGRLKKEVLEKADFLILLADLPDETAVRLAEEHPEIYVVLLLERRFRLPPPRQVNNAVLLSSVERGRYLGQLALDFDPVSRELISYQPEYIELDDSIGEDPEFKKAEEKLNRRLPAAESY